MAVGEITLKRWTSLEFSQLGELGLLGDERAELIAGDIFMMSPQGPRHAVAISLLSKLLQASLPSGFHLRVQMPLSLGTNSAPEPDLAIVPGDPRDYLAHHPTSAVLIVEVSESSLDHDRDMKEPLYASAGVAEFWLVNLTAYNIEVRRRPSPSSYLDTQILQRGEVISPPALPGVQIAIDAFLP